MSFEDEGGPWPPHCIQGTEGAEYHPDLELPPETQHLKKGTDPDEEDYSAFLGHPSLADWLHGQEIQRVFVGGLTTEYCVKNTVEDALEQGFTTFLLTDAIKPVEAEPGDEERAIAEMLEAGAVGIAYDELIL